MLARAPRTLAYFIYLAGVSGVSASISDRQLVAQTVCLFVCLFLPVSDSQSAFISESATSKMLCDVVNDAMLAAVKKVIKLGGKKLIGLRGMLLSQAPSPTHKAFLIIFKKCCRDYGHMLTEDEQKSILSFIEKTGSHAELNLSETCGNIAAHLRQLWNMTEDEEEEEEEEDDEFDLEKVQVYREFTSHIFILFFPEPGARAPWKFGETV